jgi:competence protein ComEC
MAMKIKRLACGATVSDGRFIVAMGEGELSFIEGLLERIRRPIRLFFTHKLPPEKAALFQALILGERQNVTRTMREPFAVAGTAHILAVSGLHIGLLAWTVFSTIIRILSRFYWLTLKLDVRKAAALATAVPVIAYTLLAGFHLPSQRAMIMVLAYLFSIILGREKEIWSTLALAALLVLALEPYALFSIPFQFSFGAVIGILWLVPTLYKKIPPPFHPEIKDQPWNRRVLSKIIALSLVTLAATLFLWPLTAYYFNRISLVALPANLLAVPLLGLWIIPLGLLTAVSIFISIPLAEILMALGSMGMDCMLTSLHIWSNAPFASLWVIRPNPFELVLIYSTFCITALFLQYRWAKWGILIAGLLLSLDAAYWIARTQFNRQMRITYMDVGQGSATLIEFPGRKRMLIDGGGFSGGNFDVGRMVVAPFLCYSKIRRIDYIVLSHPQADHMNGLLFIAQYFSPSEFWHNGEHVDNETFHELMRILNSQNVTIHTPVTLDSKRAMHGALVQALHPPGLSEKGAFRQGTFGVNDQSLVLKITFGRCACLFPGDIEHAGEAALVASKGPLLKSDILLTPHHGSKSSCSRQFLEAVAPDVAIISCGKGRYRQFPHPETLRRLSHMGVTAFRTDQAGALQFTLGSSQITARAFHHDDSFRSEEEAVETEGP